ncbi:tRNA(Ile)-lysidine synthetase [Methylocella silvestris BL2]|uniref:tRNA(Ile)-lysidine synthase n=1 Tax=Methylocella silvestris (strain DSM 15510 / CIP 108128 / LMG 27833 / NCIMB 13906 / BL2) TaxID=395965 RepID=B8ER05_METSB|nr:tRNA lysidine(34) synthetase TilS [Methylocella silvestris]ACK49750.1 tRNA(Ile)-lysidine synthetase [Methylocella silvestris BL2]
MLGVRPDAPERPAAARARPRSDGDAPGANGGLALDRLAADLLRPWEEAQKILLAVSGGPDSIALMLLASRWARAREERGLAAPLLHVSTVDHGLRTGSGAEAEAVAAWAKAAGLPHETLIWNGGKPKTRIQERAREARYDLLCACAARLGADVIATAHHADDQAETILFRLTRGSGPGGLAGMSARFFRHGLIHSRPLLSCDKAALIAYCEARRHDFFADPSNCNPAFARTRMRALLKLLADEGLDRAALLRLGRRAARAEEALAARARAVAADVTLQSGGGAVIDMAQLAREPQEILIRVVAAQILEASAKSGPLRLERLETLAISLRQACLDGRPYAATLGGAALCLDASLRLSIRAEAARRARPKPKQKDAENR